MAALEKLNKVLESTPTHEFDPSNFLLTCIEEFDQACLINKEYDPRDIDKALIASNAYGGIATWFLDHGFSFAGESFLIDAYNKFGQIQ